LTASLHPERKQIFAVNAPYCGWKYHDWLQESAAPLLKDASEIKIAANSVEHIISSRAYRGVAVLV